MKKIHTLGSGLLGMVCLAMAAGTALAQSKHKPAFELQAPEIRLPLMKNGPKIDGVINEKEWAGADRMQRFAGYHSDGRLTDQHGSFWVGSDEKNLYIAVRTETPPGGKILKRANPIPNANTRGVFADDNIEVVVCPNPNVPRTEQRIYHAVLNAKGAVSDNISTLRGGTKWHGHWTIKNSVKDDHWDCEISIPWKDFGLEGSPAGKTTGVRVVRNWRQTAQDAHSGNNGQSEWGLGNEAFVSLSSMPRVTWDTNAPVVQLEQLQDGPDASPNIRLNLGNPDGQSQKLAVQVKVVPTGNATTDYQQQVSLAPGASQTVDVKAAGSRGELLDTRIQVASADGKAIYYRRDFTWRVDRPAKIWNLNPEAAKRLELLFAYFPSYNTLHVKADLSNLPNRGDVKGIELAVRKKGSNQALAQTSMPPIRNNISEIESWKIPDLGEGEYELVATMRGISAQPVVNPFVRHKFDWENNKIGTSDILVAPFTAIQVKGNQLDVILRQHQLNGVGLWDQVTAQGDKLLKKPMRLEAVIDGKTVVARGTMKVTKSSDTHATVESDWQAGALKGSTLDTWDYDGVMKSVLTLQPPSAKVQSLTLVIPVDEAMAPLMHAVTFGNKFNYAGQTPQGSGVIWKSSQAPANRFIGTYVPYIWVGSQGPGLAVFGANDKGWITDDKSDCQQIVRTEDGTLELRLHLIQVPSQWHQPRRITIGFMATPAKPMPKDWRLWTVSAARTSTSTSHANAPGMYKQAFFGSYIYWGGISNSGDIYPDDGNLAIWKEFGRLRKTGKYDPQFARKWDQLAYSKVAQTRPQRAKHLGLGARAGLISMATQPQGVLIYTNAMGMRCDTPAAQTYLNEWSNTQFPQRQWGYATGVDYGATPVRSYRDMRAWWYKKSIDLFNDAIYWDCVMLNAVTNLNNSDAYIRPDGRLQPAADLWQKRDLVRRGAVLIQEMGRTNRNMVHMSGTEIVPINDFSATQADWELKYGAGDFQDKFPRDYIQAQTIGRQAGLVPIVLLNQKFIVGNKQEAAQQYRTAAGVMLSHELKPWSSRGQWVKPDCFWVNYDRLVEFGYGQESTTTYDYWQKDYPVKISGESSSLLVSKPSAKSAMLVLCDYGDGGTFKVQLDAKRLSLSGNLKAVNVETNEAVKVDGDTLSVPLKKHDFMVIRIEAE